MAVQVARAVQQPIDPAEMSRPCRDSAGVANVQPLPGDAVVFKRDVAAVMGRRYPGLRKSIQQADDQGPADAATGANNINLLRIVGHMDLMDWDWGRHAGLYVARQVPDQYIVGPSWQ